MTSRREGDLAVKLAQYERLVEATAPPLGDPRCHCDRCEDARRLVGRKAS